MDTANPADCGRKYHSANDAKKTGYPLGGKNYNFSGGSQKSFSKSSVQEKKFLITKISKTQTKKEKIDEIH